MGSDASFRVGNVVDLEDFDDKTFDFIYDSHLLHCIIGSDRKKLLSNIDRVLKPKGYFLVDTMCFSELTLQFDYFDIDSKCTIMPNGITTRYIGEEEDIAKELRDSGFIILSKQRHCDSDGHVVLVETTKGID